MASKVKLFLDSGAYGAWSRKLDLPLKDYIKYLKRLEDQMFAYVNMDVIPGVFGMKRAHGDFEIGAKGSHENLHRMLDAGLKPIPVIHQGESLEWLHKHLDEGHPYIGVSATKDPFADHQSWLNQVFSMICDKQGRPRVKVHGFGITTPKILSLYPFYSVDSTAWLLTPAYGHIVMPSIDLKGNYDVLSPTRVITSLVEHETTGHNKLNFNLMGPLKRAAVEKYAREKIGVAMHDLQYDPNARRKSLVVYYEQLIEGIYPVRFKGHIPKLTLSDAPGKDLKLNVIHVLSWQPTMSDILLGCGARHHLLSYAEIKDRSDNDLKHYVKTGKMLTRPVKKRKANWADSFYTNSRALNLHRRQDANADQPL